jgi:DNA polymerase I
MRSALFKHLAARYIIPAAVTKGGGLCVAFDIEADGLLDTATKLHCVVVANLDTDEVNKYGPDRIGTALEHLKRADYLVGHNICGYDLPLLHRLHDWTPAPGCTIVDTLIAARLILPHLDDIDTETKARTGTSLGKLHGRYNLEAFGARLGMSKTGADIEDFSEWTPELQARCVGDVEICKVLWRFLQPDGYSPEALKLEHRVSVICNRLTVDGIPFDVKAAEQLRQQWTARRADLEVKLSEQFPNTNLNSRAQIGAWLEARGWIPEKRTEKTHQPKIDDELLETIPELYPEFTGLAEHFTLNKRLAQLAKGAKAWLKHVGNDGRLHGAIVHIGTPHSRAAHFGPNIAQVPNPKRGKPLAVECRALFRHPGDWVFVTCDQAGLQDRCFSHYLAEFDNGAYGRSFVAGADTHWNTAAALELISSDTKRDKTSKLHTALREGSKSFRYGFLFGMRGKRAGEIITTIIRAARQIDPTYVGPSTDGALALRRFQAVTPGLMQLRQKLEAQAAQTAWVPGLDGRRVPTGAQYKALNRIVTSAEAIVCKRWLTNVHAALCTRLRYGWADDVVIAAWIHDELVCCCRPDFAKAVGEIMVKYAKEAGEHYGLKVPLDAEYTIGRSWAGEPLNDAREHEQHAGDDNGVGEIPADLSIPTFLMRGSPTATTIGLGATPGGLTAILVGDHDDNGPGVDRAPKTTNGSGGSKISCPFHDDPDPSLHLYPDGHYHCFGCGAHGAIEELPEPPSVPAPASNASTDTLKSGMSLWQAAVSIRGTLAERYLVEIRKLDLGVIPDLDTVLRFHPTCPFNGSVHPCLIALFRDVETNEAAGIQRIALTAKAEKIDRMMLGSWPSQRAIKLRPNGDNLLIGEGIETTIAGEMKVGWRSALWALGSAAAIGQLPVITDVKQLGVLVDREHSGVGEEASRRCATRWRYADRKVVVLMPQRAGVDFNDLVKEQGA